MPPPPPPPPPGPGPPPPSFNGGSKAGGKPNRSALLDQIHHGARLKKAVTNDRSAPQLGAVKSTGGGHGGSGGGGSTGGGGPAAMGGLFAGGMPKLKSAGQNRVPGGAGGPALKPPGSMANGPTNVCSNENNRLSNGGPTQSTKINKFGQPAPPPTSQSKPRNVGPPPPPIPGNQKPSNGGAPGRLNSDAFKRFNSLSIDEDSACSDTPRLNVSSVAGGLASRSTPHQSSVPKPPVPSGGASFSAATPPPPPVRPPPSDGIRRNSMVGRPLPPPPPPGDSENIVSGSSRPPPPPPSRGVAPPPPPPNRGSAPPPPPPQRTANNISAVATIGRSGPPNIRPPTPRRSSTGGGISAPPQIQPPSNSGNRLTGSNSSCGDDFETKYRFHQSNEFPPPEPVSNTNKVYPSKTPRNSAHQRPPPPQPPR